jgi:co-chaperonin GroES (HSP10)
MLQYTVDKIIVEIEQKYQDKQNGLQIDVSYAPEEYATLKGTVVSVPLRVDKAYWKGDIEQLAKIGDEVWFSYGIIYDYKTYKDRETPVYKNLLLHEGKEYWKVDYSEVFCIKRDGQILMPTQHVILAPVKDDRELITPSGISLVKEHLDYQDRGEIVALPKTDISVKVGDIVPLERQYMQHYILFGKKHYIVPTRRIIAKF